MKQIEALAHVAHSGGSLYVLSGWRGHKYLVCQKDSITIGMPILERLLEREDLQIVADHVVLTEQGTQRL